MIDGAFAKVLDRRVERRDLIVPKNTTIAGRSGVIVIVHIATSCRDVLRATVGVDAVEDVDVKPVDIARTCPWHRIGLSCDILGNVCNRFSDSIENLRAGRYVRYWVRVEGSIEIQPQPREIRNIDLHEANHLVDRVKLRLLLLSGILNGCRGPLICPRDVSGGIVL